MRIEMDDGREDKLDMRRVVRLRWTKLSATTGFILSLRGAGLAVLLAMSCALPAHAAAGTPSLYDRIGGAPVMSAVVDETLDRAAADPRLGRSFEGVNMKRLKKHVKTFLCAEAGGGCAWTGDSMKQAHAGLNISEAEMYGFVEVFTAALDHQGVGQREKNELLALLAPMKRDIVTNP